MSRLAYVISVAIILLDGITGCAGSRSTKLGASASMPDSVLMLYRAGISWIDNDPSVAAILRTSDHVRPSVSTLTGCFDFTLADAKDTVAEALSKKLPGLSYRAALEGIESAVARTPCIQEDLPPLAPVDGNRSSRYVLVFYGSIVRTPYGVTILSAQLFDMGFAGEEWTRSTPRLPKIVLFWMFDSKGNIIDVIAGEVFAEEW